MLYIRNKLKNLFKRKEDGQGLVEMAIIAPILIFMLIGLIEVGYALWGYMTLVGLDREVTRYSIRPNVLDFSKTNKEDIGYNNVVTHTLVSNSGVLRLNEFFENTISATEPDAPVAGLVVTHIMVDTRKPCEGANCCPNDWEVDDWDSPPSGFTDYTRDDMVLYPDKDGYEYLRYIYPDPAQSTTAITSNIDSVALAAQLKAENDIFNCQLQRKLGEDATDYSSNSVVVVETFYDQPQMLSFPLFAWLGNPLHLYAQTMMRIDSGATGCELYPLIVHEDTVIDLLATGEGNIWEILPGGNAKGWIEWNALYSGAPQTYLVEMLTNPRLSANDYLDPTDTSPQDPVISADDVNDAAPTAGQSGDWVSSLNGAVASVEPEMDAIVGRTIMIPVYDVYTGSGTNVRYRIIGFAKIQITSFSLPDSNRHVNAIVREYPVENVCPGNGY